MDDQFRMLLDAIADSAIILDKNGRIVDWNPSAGSMFGYPKKEVVGRSLNLVFEQNQPFPKIINEILTKEKKWISEIRFVRKNGVKGYCTTSATLLNTGDEKVYALITIHNLTNYKNTENELREKLENLIQEVQSHSEICYSTQLLLINNIASLENIEKKQHESELRFRLLAENATDLISTHTPDGAYLYASPSSKTLVGYTPEELSGRVLFRLLHHDDVSKLKKLFARRKESKNYFTITYRVRHKEGEYRWFESNIRIIRDEDTHITREIQCASRDVTDRIRDKKARLRGQQLAHVFRLSTMEEMASGMAHEISQPLAAIVNYTRGCVRHLQKGHHDNNLIVGIMQKAVTQAERAGEVIHRLKNFFCKGQLFKSPCKLNGIIRETVSLMKNDLHNAKTKIDFELSKSIPLISADKIQLQQVISNLIQNAIDAMREAESKKRRIQIQTQAADNEKISITVSDSGPGFSKEIISNVFKPFFTTKAHGRGMGLAICRSIVEAHGGEFTINPNTNNESWIRFTLPIV